MTGEQGPLFVTYRAGAGLAKICFTVAAGLGLFGLWASISVEASDALALLARPALLALIFGICLMFFTLALFLQWLRKAREHIIALDNGFLTAPRSLLSETVTLDLSQIHQVKLEGRGAGKWLTIKTNEVSLKLDARFFEGPHAFDQLYSRVKQTIATKADAQKGHYGQNDS